MTSSSSPPSATSSGDRDRRPSAPPTGDGAKRRLALAAVLAFVGTAIYANGFDGVFLFDDHASIHQNPLVHDLTTAWRTPKDATYTVAGRPVLSFTLGLNYAFGELDPFGYHAVNVVIHVLNTLLLFGLVRRLLLAPRYAASFRRSADGLAFAVALLWCVHPIQTGSVTYIIQRAESLMGLFFLATCYAAVRGFASDRHWPWFAAAVAACLIGAGAKEVIAVAPLVVLLADRVFFSPTWRTALRRHRWLYVGLVFVWPLSAAFVLSSARVATAVDPDYTVGALAYLKTQAGVIAHYGRLALWPAPLVLHYGWPIAERAADWLAPGLAVLAALAACLVAFRRRPWVTFIGAWFFLILAPSSSLVPIPREIAAEHRLYLPLAAIVALLVLVVHQALGRWIDASPVRRTIGVGLLVACGVTLSMLTVRRNEAYTDALAMWRGVAELRPDNPIAAANLGWVEDERGNHEAARRAFERATALNPKSAEHRANLGGVLTKLGRHDEALAAYRRALAIDPDHFAANHVVGLTLLTQKNDPAAARPFLARAVAVRPDRRDATDLLIEALVRTNDVKSLVEVLERAVVAQPDRDDLIVRLGGTHARFGDPLRAVTLLTAAHRRAPQDPKITQLLAWLLAAHPDRGVRDPDAAIRIIDTTTDRLGRKTVELGDARAAALAAKGDFEGAIELARAAAAYAAKSGRAPFAQAIMRHVEYYRAPETTAAPVVSARPAESETA